MISVPLKGFENLIECSKVRSNGSLLNHLIEQETDFMSNKVLAHKDCKGDYTNLSWKITETRKYDNSVKPTDQREKVLIGKHIVFSAENSVLQIRSTLISVKVGTWFMSSYLFKPLFSVNVMKELKNVQMMY